MIKLFPELFLLLCLIPVYSFGQEIDTGPNYQYLLISNPGLTGIEGDGTLRLSYLNIYPGNNYNLHSVYLSYDSYVPDLHGGAAFYLSDDYEGGIINNIKGGLSYAYYLQAGKNFFINAGLSASVYHRGYSFDEAVFPDQIDPLGGVSFPSSENLSSRGSTAFDVGTGFLIIAGRVYGGLSISHLTEPDLSTSGFSEDKLKRKYLLHITGDIYLDAKQKVKLSPLAYLVFQDSFISAGTGAVVETNYLAINALLLGNNDKNLNIQTGFFIKTGKISLFYNYRFNIKSGNQMLPLSLIHQTGLAIGLNNVDKRKAIKTINFPKL
jgi:type IX secretion system PorP/SprF family membrane protein